MIINVLWLTEALSQKLGLRPGMRVWCGQHWAKAGKVDVLSADCIPGGWRQWLLWNQIYLEAGYPAEPKEVSMLESDAGKNIGFTRVIAQRK